MQHCVFIGGPPAQFIAGKMQAMRLAIRDSHNEAAGVDNFADDFIQIETDPPDPSLARTVHLLPKNGEVRIELCLKTAGPVTLSIMLRAGKELQHVHGSPFRTSVLPGDAATLQLIDSELQTRSIPTFLPTLLTFQSFDESGNEASTGGGILSLVGSSAAVEWRATDHQNGRYSASLVPTQRCDKLELELSFRAQRECRLCLCFELEIGSAVAALKVINVTTGRPKHQTQAELARLAREVRIATLEGCHPEQTGIVDLGSKMQVVVRGAESIITRLLPSDLLCHILSPSNSAIESSCAERSAGCFVMGFNPTESGSHRVAVSAFGIPIQGSPFTVIARSGVSAGRTEVKGAGLCEMVAGELASFSVHIKDEDGSSVWDRPTEWKSQIALQVSPPRLSYARNRAK